MRRVLTVTKPALIKLKRRGIKLIRETALAREKRIFLFSTSCVASKFAAKQAQLPQLCTFYPAR